MRSGLHGLHDRFTTGSRKARVFKALGVFGGGFTVFTMTVKREVVAKSLILGLHGLHGLHALRGSAAAVKRRAASLAGRKDERMKTDIQTVEATYSAVPRVRLADSEE
jgi:hypothetical protein